MGLELAKIILSLSLLMPLLGSALTSIAFGQTSTATLAGKISDPSNAILAGAAVTLAPSQGGQPRVTATNQEGFYEFVGLEPGTYTLSVTAPGFSIFVKDNIAIRSGQTQRIDIALTIQTEKQEIQVSDDSAKLDVSASSNVDSVTITEKDLDAFSDDPDELEAELTALAGPSAGPSGGQFYVDGFTVEDQLPPKNSICEIRVNQNPFSAEYDKLGYGRIEIFTKPGTDQFHGKFTLDGNDCASDTRDPFAVGEPGYHSLLVTGDVSGPLTKMASFFFDFQNRNLENNGVVNAIVLDPAFNQIAFAETISSPSSRTVLGPAVLGHSEAPFCQPSVERTTRSPYMSAVVGALHKDHDVQFRCVPAFTANTKLATKGPSRF